MTDEDAGGTRTPEPRKPAPPPAVAASRTEPTADVAASPTEPTAPVAASTAGPSSPFGDWPAAPPEPDEVSADSYSASQAASAPAVPAQPVGAAQPAAPTEQFAAAEPFATPGPAVSARQAGGRDPWGAPPVPPPPAVPGVSAPPAGEGPVVARVGELAVTSSTVHTPAGPIPLPGSTWQVSDHWMTEQKTATWAVVAAILSFCLVGPFSLLFLLVKKTTYRGTVQVILTNGQRQYVARIPVDSQAAVQQIHQQVNYVRSLAAL